MSVSTPNQQYKFNRIKSCLFPAAVVFLIVMWTVFPCEVLRSFLGKERALTYFLFVAGVLLYLLVLAASFAVLFFFPGFNPTVFKVATAICITCLVCSYVFTVRMLARNEF